MNVTDGANSAGAPHRRAASDSATGADDPRVVRALEEYTAAVDAGRPPDRREFQARYPDIASAVAECLEGLDFVRGAAAQLSLPAASGIAGSKRTANFWPADTLGDYRIVGEIGRGGMGVVYEVIQVSLGRRVALKVLPFAAAMDSKQLQRFKNEAQAAAQLHHQHIVPVYGVGCERGVHYYAMQFIDGQTLAALIAELRSLAGLDRKDVVPATLAAAALAADLLTGRWAPAPRPATEIAKESHSDSMIQANASRQRQNENGSPNEPPSFARTTSDSAVTAITENSRKSPAFFRTAANLAMQAATAIEHAHGSGVIHRDVKPANLLLDTRGNLWITDFGLAHCQSQAGLTMTGDLMGTLRYMSPEQALAQRVSLDHRTDIYSLGATLYELLTLEPVFDGRDRQELLRQIAADEPRRPRSLNKAIPAELETIVMKAMEKNPSDRYATAQDMADDLQRYLKDEPIRARPPSLLEKTKKWMRRHSAVVRTALATFSLSIVAVAVVASGAAWRLNREKGQTEQALEKEQAALARMEAALTLADGRAKQIEQGLRRLNAGNALMQRGRWNADAGQWSKAHADLSEAVELHPENSTVWYERTELYARLGLFDLAAKDCARGFRLQKPTVTRQWFCRALLTVYADDANGYREVCRLASKQFDTQGQDVPGDNEIVRACTIAPPPEADLEWLEEMALRVVERDGEACWNLTALGMAHFRAGNYDQAIASLKRSLSAGNWQAGCQTNSVLAMAHYRAGRPGEAVDALRKATAVLDGWGRQWLESSSPSLPFWWHDWAPCYLLHGEAKTLIDGAPPIEDPRIWVVRGRALAALRRHDESQACYERALTLAPDDLAIRLAMLPTAADLDQRARQLAEMDEFLRSHPEQPEATRRTLAQRHFDLGESLCHAKRDSDARDAYGRAVELAPAFKEACEKKGSKSLALFRYREAIEEFSQVIDLDPKHASSWCSRGFAYRHLGRVDAALADNSRAVELASDVAEHWYHRGVDYAHLGQHDKAIADFSEAVKIDPMHVWAFSDRGLAHEDLNEFDGAVADYSKALELAADHHATINNLAWLLANCSDPRFRDAGRATELAKRAVDLAPRDGGFWNTLGAAHYRAGDWKGAVLALTKATELRQGGTLSDWLFLAMAERRLENKEAARRWYDQATAWIQRNKPLAKDLERFRVEAAELLGGG